MQKNKISIVVLIFFIFILFFILSDLIFFGNKTVDNPDALKRTDENDNEKNKYEILEIYLIKYGESNFNIKEIFYDSRNDSGVKICFDWLFYLIKYDDQYILVDCGFENEKYKKMFNLYKYENPITILEKNEIQPKNIEKLILTHEHFDHIGCAKNFKDSELIISKNSFYNISNKSEYLSLEQIDEQVLFSGSYSFNNIFEIEEVGGHAKGSSMLIINLPENTQIIYEYNSNNNFQITNESTIESPSLIIFAGDECYVPENYIQNRIIGSFYSLQSLRKNTNWLNEIYKNKKGIILLSHQHGFLDNTGLIKLYELKIPIKNQTNISR
jgi:glyoxylase-like metal-dependent hydrolase (beta-lactamase superfamily II)